jgi:hypothetical protein
MDRLWMKFMKESNSDFKSDKHCQKALDYIGSQITFPVIC